MLFKIDMTHTPYGVAEKKYDGRIMHSTCLSAMQKTEKRGEG